MRQKLLTIVWGRLVPNETFDQTVTTAVECEKLLEIRQKTVIKNVIIRPAIKRILNDSQKYMT